MCVDLPPEPSVVETEERRGSFWAHRCGSTNKTHTPSDIPTPVFEMRSGRERGSMPGNTIMNKGICIIIPHKQHSDCIEKARQEGKDIDYAIRCDVQGDLWRCLLLNSGHKRSRYGLV